MTYHHDTQSMADRAARNEAELTYAREILADIAHHKDDVLAEACDSILHLSRDAPERAQAQELLTMIARDPQV